MRNTCGWSNVFDSRKTRHESCMSKPEFARTSVGCKKIATLQRPRQADYTPRFVMKQTYKGGGRSGLLWAIPKTAHPHRGGTSSKLVIIETPEPCYRRLRITLCRDVLYPLHNEGGSGDSVYTTTADQSFTHGSVEGCPSGRHPKPARHTEG